MSSPPPSSTYHDLTPTIGGCGRFQVTITVTVHSASVMAAWGVMFMAFGIYNPGWACLDQPIPAHNVINASLIYNNSIVMDNQFLGHVADRDVLISFPNSTKIMPFTDNKEESYYDDNNNITDWITECGIRQTCQDLVYNKDSNTIVTEWGLYCGLEWVPSLIISIEMGGVLIGSYVSGIIGDKFGRKVCLYGSLFFLGVCQFIAIFSTSWEMYAGLLCLVGVSVGGILSCTFVYPLEFVTEKWRGVLAAMPIWNVGCTVFAAFAVLLRNWRHIHLTACILTTLLSLTVFWTPESVRWLAVSGKENKAKKVVAKIARMNSRPCPDISIIDNLAMEERAVMRGHKYSYLDLFRIKALRYHSIKFGLIWIIMAIVYYSISFGIKSLSGNFYINLFIFSIFELPGMLFVAPAVNTLGRRKASLLYFAVACICACAVVAVYFTSSGSVLDTCTLIFALCCKTIIVGVWSITSVFSSELYPTVVRSLHYGYLNAVSRFGAMISPYLIPSDSSDLYMVFLIIAILCLGCCGLVLSLPETKGRPMLDRPGIQNGEVQALQDLRNNNHTLVVSA